MKWFQHPNFVYHFLKFPGQEQSLKLLQEFENEQEIFLKVNWKAEQGDIENLFNYEPNYFDTYYGGFVFHLTDNPKQALNEAYRILKSGGKLGFSVWGRKEYSDNYVIVKQTAIEIGYKFPESHDAFRLGADKLLLKQVLEEIGFKNILMWYQNTAADRFTAQSLIECLNPSMINFLQNENELFHTLLKRLTQKLQTKFALQNEPLLQECLIVIAQK